MELNVLEKTKNRIKVEIQGEGHTLCNILRDELWNVKGTEIAGYRVEHPLVSSPVLILETGKEKPEKVLLNAISKLKKRIKELREEGKKLE
jgi:DNA-directed RNA polymerase subunit L